MVPASTSMVPVRARRIDSAVVTRIATHGVRRPGRTRASTRGSSPSDAMP